MDVLHQSLNLALSSLPEIVLEKLITKAQRPGDPGAQKPFQAKLQNIF
jgi:hypothetical protein